MKKHLYLAACALAASLIIPACKEKKKDSPEPTATENVAPTVVLTFPTNNWGAIVNNDSTIVITASASDSDGSITKVEFYSGNLKIGEDMTSPYAISYLFTANISYFIKVVATDDKGSTITSSINKATLFQN